MIPTEKVRVTKRFTFEMAHSLRCHDGLCANIHGHSYVLDVTILGVPITTPGHAKDGMVIDFADLKSIVKRAVVDRYDHALVLNENDRSDVNTDHSLFGRVVFTLWQPRCENLLLDMVRTLREQLPAEAPLHFVCLQETATSWAEWSREDR